MINVQLLQLPARIKAVSTKNEDNSYTIILNSGLNYEQQLLGYKHEINHIENNDFDKEDVNIIEKMARAIE